jgi:hypothetical protein
MSSHLCHGRHKRWETLGRVCPSATASPKSAQAGHEVSIALDRSVSMRDEPNPSQPRLERPCLANGQAAANGIPQGDFSLHNVFLLPSQSPLSRALMFFFSLHNTQSL